MVRRVCTRNRIKNRMWRIDSASPTTRALLQMTSLTFMEPSAFNQEFRTHTSTEQLTGVQHTYANLWAQVWARDARANGKCSQTGLTQSLARTQGSSGVWVTSLSSAMANRLVWFSANYAKNFQSLLQSRENLTYYGVVHLHLSSIDTSPASAPAFQHPQKSHVAE